MAGGRRQVRSMNSPRPAGMVGAPSRRCASAEAPAPRRRLPSEGWASCCGSPSRTMLWVAPAKSREHVLLWVLAERRLQQGQTAELGYLLEEVLTPPIERAGALDVNDFLPSSPRGRKNLAATSTP